MNVPLLLAVRPKFSCWKRSLLAPSNLLITGASIAIAIFPAFAYAQSGSPFDTGFTNLQNLFTGTIAKVASLIAIVIGGYSLAHGEPGAKRASTRATGGSPRCLLSGELRQWLKPKRILLPVRHLQQWIEHNILLELGIAPFSKEDAQLVPEAGSCLECPKRTGHNVLLFSEIGKTHPDSCSDPKCYQAKLDAFVQQTIAAKPKLVQISTAYENGRTAAQSFRVTEYVEIRPDKPKGKNDRDWPEYKTCEYMAEAMVTEDGVPLSR